MLRTGICLTAIYPEAMFDKDKLIKAIKQTAQTGIFNGVEYYFEGKEEDYIEIRDLIKELDLYSVFLAGYPMKSNKIDISARDETIRRKSVVDSFELIKRGMKLASDKVLILSGPVWEKEDRELLVSQSVKSIRELTNMNRDKADIPEISLEFFNNSGEPYLALGDFETIKLLCKELSGINFGITYDFSHAMQLGMDIKSTVRELLPWIHHIHIANSVSKEKASPLYGDKHPLFGIENEDLSLDEVLYLLQGFQKNDYLKNISICSMEVISRNDHSPEWYFEQTVNQARILLSDF